MKVLGISGSERDAAAALSVDGSVIAAAAEESFARVPHIGYGHSGFYPLAAIDACLTRGGLDIHDVDRVVVVNDSRTAGGPPAPTDAAQFVDPPDLAVLERALRTRSCQSIEAVVADARQLTAAAAEDDLVVAIVTSEAGASGLFRRCGSDLVPLHSPGLYQLHCAIKRVSHALGFDGRSRYEVIENLGSMCGSEDSQLFDGAISWRPATGVSIDEAGLERALGPVRQHPAGASVNVRFQHDRQLTAASFCARMNVVTTEMLAYLASKAGVRKVGLGGSLASQRGLVAAAARAFGSDLLIAPVPEACGRALGAALDGTDAAKPLHTLALGPEFTEQEIKITLENCRLDYLYEPDWSRLLARVSRMLSRGTVVAWFQGAASFGPRPIGSRGILADPSNRYARENINRFLRHVAVDEPLPVAMTSTAARECIEAAPVSPFVTMNATVKDGWHDRLRAAIEARGSVPVQILAENEAPTFHRLLQLHRESSGVPALINVPFCGSNEPPVCTPRDAVRTMFSSAIDALVIGRFLLMKDYWLLRSNAE